MSQDQWHVSDNDSDPFSTDEVRVMVSRLHEQITELSNQLRVMGPKVDELTTYLERGKGIFWLFKLGCIVAPVAGLLVSGVYWALNHFKP